MGDAVYVKAFWTYVAVQRDSQKGKIVRKVAMLFEFINCEG